MIKHRVLTYLTLLFLGIGGCQRSEPDLAASFDAVAQRFVKQLKANFGAQTFLKSTIRLADSFEHDLKKTDSLITPYRGTITIAWVARHAEGEEEGAYLFMIVLKEDKWVLERSFNTLKKIKFFDPKDDELLRPLMPIDKLYEMPVNNTKGTVLELILSAWERAEPAS